MRTKKVRAILLLVLLTVTAMGIMPVQAEEIEIQNTDLCTVRDWLDVTEKGVIGIESYPDCPNGFAICRSCRVWKECHGGQGRYYWCCDGYLYYPCCA